MQMVKLEVFNVENLFFWSIFAQKMKKRLKFV